MLYQYLCCKTGMLITIEVLEEQPAKNALPVKMEKAVTQKIAFPSNSFLSKMPKKPNLSD